MAENPAAEGGAEGGKKKGGKGKFILILLLGGLGFGGYTFQKNKAAAAIKAAAEWTANPIYETVVYSMEPQTVNLADGDRYLRCQVALGFEFDPVDAAYFREHTAKEDKGGGEHGGEGGAEEAPKPERMPPKKEADEPVRHLVHRLNSEEVRAQLQDILISELTARTFDELSTLEGKEALKAALETSFNGVLAEHEASAAPEPTDHGAADGESTGGKTASAHESGPPVKAVYLREFVMQ